MPPPFDAGFMQRALVEVLLLSVPAGILGSWIVLRRFAFFTHGVGTAALPGLVLAGPLGLAPQLVALGSAVLYAFGLERLVRGRGVAPDAATGLLLIAALALGVMLASDVFESGSGIDRLLFGSLIGLEDSDLWLTAGAAILVLAIDATLGRNWLVEGFDAGGARRLGMRARAGDTALLLTIALGTVVALAAVGALLVTAVFVIPAATVRLVAPSLTVLRTGAVALAAVEGVAALWLAHALNVGPGPALAVLGGVVFAGVAAGSALRDRRQAVRLRPEAAT